MRGVALMTPIVLAGVLLAGGCAGKLNHETTVDVGLSETKEIRIDPAKKEQTVHIAVEVTGGPIDVFVYLEKDKEEAEKAILALKDEKVLAGRRRVTDAQKLQAVVPANDAAIVHLSSAGKSGSVKVKINN